MPVTTITASYSTALTVASSTGWRRVYHVYPLPVLKFHFKCIPKNHESRISTMIADISIYVTVNISIHGNHKSQKINL